jgi:hypothetical protein
MQIAGQISVQINRRGYDLMTAQRDNQIHILIELGCSFVERATDRVLPALFVQCAGETV